MKKVENQCCGCAAPGYPCLGASCPNRRVIVYYCDKCRQEIEGDMYEAEGYDLCEECLKEMFRKEI